MLVLYFTFCYNDYVVLGNETAAPDCRYPIGFFRLLSNAYMKEVKKLSVFCFIGNALMSVLCSVIGNIIDRCLQSRKMEKGVSTSQSKRP